MIYIHALNSGDRAVHSPLDAFDGGAVREPVAPGYAATACAVAVAVGGVCGHLVPLERRNGVGGQ